MVQWESSMKQRHTSCVGSLLRQRYSMDWSQHRRLVEVVRRDARAARTILEGKQTGGKKDEQITKIDKSTGSILG